MEAVIRQWMAWIPVRPQRREHITLFACRWYTRAVVTDPPFYAFVIVVLSPMVTAGVPLFVKSSLDQFELLEPSHAQAACTVRLLFT